MLVVNTLLALSDHLLLYLAFILLAGLIGIGLNYIFLRTCVSGLIFLQTSFVFNTAIILFGWGTGAVSAFRVAHFLIYELTVVIGIYWVYRKLLRTRARIFENLQHLNVKAISALLVLFNCVLFGLYLLLVVGNNGVSRIEFMTASWFSFFRPIASILEPLSFFFPLYLLDRGKRLLPLSILASSVISNIASGSKGSFVFGAIGSLLLYEDLKGSKLVIPRALKFLLFILISLSAVFALERLDVSMVALAQRFVRFGESTIMVYYSADPSAAASGVSTFAKIHRGAAKLLGDRSAADIDTVFGFALSRDDNGAHNFTGPNAAISSYMLCNYSGWQNLIGFASILGYMAIVAWFVEHLIYRQMPGCLMLLPFVVASLNSFLQDYYQGMSDVTLMLIAALAFAGIGVTTLACRGARSVHGAA
jgi:hypothetical protein